MGGFPTPLRYCYTKCWEIRSLSFSFSTNLYNVLEFCVSYLDCIVFYNLCKHSVLFSFFLSVTLIQENGAGIGFIGSAYATAFPGNCNGSDLLTARQTPLRANAILQRNVVNFFIFDRFTRLSRLCKPCQYDYQLREFFLWQSELIF